ncbi:MAG: hypothetical protein PHV11_01555 [Candidatus Bipolaricaulis sp.]|nr:hypothetical protein [Candidatus Bipolaricaulis sp.]
MRGSSINYEGVLSRLSAVDYDGLVARLRKILPSLWLRAYRKMTPTPVNTVRFEDRGFEFLFDHASARRTDSGPEDAAVEDRIIAAFGRSRPSLLRQEARTNGLLGSSAAVFGGRAKRDHVPGGVLGGACDGCLYPQRRDLRRESSVDGRAFRTMERYCTEHPGTFAFSRPVYDSPSWWPCEIEHGLLRDDGTLWVQGFDNAAASVRIPFLATGRATLVEARRTPAPG